MSHSFVISNRVIKTIKALPEEERKVISDALASELLLGEEPMSGMSSLQAMIYSVVRYYIKRDTEHACGSGGTRPFESCSLSL